MYWEAISQQAYEETANFISSPVTINHDYEKDVTSHPFVEAIRRSLIIPVVGERWINNNLLHWWQDNEIMLLLWKNNSRFSCKN